MKGNILSADGIRAIAALSVLIHHFFERLNTEKQGEAVQSLQQFDWGSLQQNQGNGAIS